jgi:hypothetical protein
MTIVQYKKPSELGYDRFFSMRQWLNNLSIHSWRCRGNYQLEFDDDLVATEFALRFA